MTKNNGFKVAALAASIALAMAATSAMAADPAATQLPGQGKTLLGTPAITITTGTGTATMAIAAGANAVINWGAGSGAEGAGNLNSTGTAGFNIGSGGTVNVTGGNLLNIDSTGNPSQIFGTLTAAGGDVYVANSNGIIVGATGVITGNAGLIANSIATIYDPTTFAGTITDYQGTGGDVTVQKGAAITGGTLFVSGGGVVNVDMTGITSTTTISAGLHGGTNPLAVDNTAASAIVTGTAAGSTVASLSSAGTATTNGTLTVGTNGVAGMLTNTGDLTLPVANNGVHNQGKLTTSAAAADFGSLTNDGTYTVNGSSFTVTGGDLTNNGTITGTTPYSAYVTNGSIVNNGTISGGDDFETYSDATLTKSFTAGASYSITNAGTITSPDDLYFEANDQYNQSKLVTGDEVLNGSGGGFFNTGTLQVAPAEDIYVGANNNISLGGMIQTNDGAGHVKGLSATNPLSSVDLEAGNYDFNDKFTSGGSVTLATDVTTNGGAFVAGNQVMLMSNLSSVDNTGAGTATVDIIAGPQQATDYAVRVAAGKTVTAGTIDVDGDVAADNPNVILQGTLMANTFNFGASQSISDLLSGPGGSLVVTGAAPVVNVSFTGAVKTAKYNNDANFRFNYLPISLTSDAAAPLQLTLDPTAYATNGTSNGLSAVNVLVNGDVDLLQGTVLGGVTAINGTSSAVTGVLNVPNTHLVLQSTGNITTPAAGYYWPGYVYLGNISADTTGNAQPGTLGLGTIALKGNFSNVLPGDIAGASGIHLITQFPLTLGGDVTTNANAWVNFGSDLLTQGYSTGTLGNGQFFGGAQGSGNVINYGALPAGSFVTQLPVSNK